MDRRRGCDRVAAGLPARVAGGIRSTGGCMPLGCSIARGTLELAAEDVGRHNAVDKIVGRTLLAGKLPLDMSILLVSGADLLRAGPEGANRGHPVDCRGVGAVEPRDRPCRGGKHHACVASCRRPRLQYLQCITRESSVKSSLKALNLSDFDCTTSFVDSSDTSRSTGLEPRLLHLDRCAALAAGLASRP